MDISGPTRNIRVLFYSCCRPRVLLTAVLLLLQPIVACAGFISTPAVQLAYDGQVIVFDWYLPGEPVVDADLVTIDNNDELQQLFGIGTAPFPMLNAFFVDAINFCPGEEYQPNFGIVGCAKLPGNVMILNSVFASGNRGALVIGHEFGHNANLEHDQYDETNIMYPIIGGNWLDRDQWFQILLSGFIQIDPNGRQFIAILPIAVVAEAVPEPTTLALMGLGIAVLGFSRRSRKAMKNLIPVFAVFAATSSISQAEVIFLWQGDCDTNCQSLPQFVEGFIELPDKFSNPGAFTFNSADVLDFQLQPIPGTILTPVTHDVVDFQARSFFEVDFDGAVKLMLRGPIDAQLELLLDPRIGFEGTLSIDGTDASAIHRWSFGGHQVSGIGRLVLAPQVIPVPATISLLAPALAGLSLFRWRKLS